MLREGLEGLELTNRLSQLGPDASTAIAQRLVREDAPTAQAMGNALARMDGRSAQPVLLSALRDPSTPAPARAGIMDLLLRMGPAPSWMEDEGLPAEFRYAAAERLWRRGELAPLERVIAALSGISRSDPSFAERVESLRTRLRRRSDEPEEVVIDLPDPEPPPATPRRRPEEPEPRRESTGRVNLLLGFGAAALAAVLLATRRRA